MKAHTRAYGPQNTPLNITQYPFFSAAHEAFSKREHILRDEASLAKYQTTEINPITLSYHDGIKLETNSKGIDRKHPYLQRWENTLLNDQWIIEKNERGKSF